MDLESGVLRQQTGKKGVRMDYADNGMPSKILTTICKINVKAFLKNCSILKGMTSSMKKIIPLGLTTAR
jgi:hypothetical protein